MWSWLSALISGLLRAVFDWWDRLRMHGKAEQADDLEATLDRNRRARDAVDRFDSDPKYADSVRKRTIRKREDR